MTGSIKFLSDQTPIPGQNGVRPGNAGEVFKSFPPETPSDLSQGDPLWVGEPQPSRQLGSQNPILAGQILVLYKELPAYTTGDVSQEPHPFVVPHRRLSYASSLEFFDHTGCHPLAFDVSFAAAPPRSLVPRSAHLPLLVIH